MGEKRAGRKQNVPYEEGQPVEGDGQKALKRKNITEMEAGKIKPKNGLQFNEDTVKVTVHQ